MESNINNIYIIMPTWNFGQAENDDDGAEDEVKKSAAEADDDGTQAEGGNDDKAEIAETQVEMGKRGDARETENADEADIAETQAEMGKRGDTREAENADEELRTEDEEAKEGQPQASRDRGEAEIADAPRGEGGRRPRGRGEAEVADAQGGEVASLRGRNIGGADEAEDRRRGRLARAPAAVHED